MTAFEAGPAGHFSNSRDRFHRKRQTTLFLTIFSWISAVFQNPFIIITVEGPEKNVKKRSEKISFKLAWKVLANVLQLEVFGFLFGLFRPRSEGLGRGSRVWARVDQFRSGSIRSYQGR